MKYWGKVFYAALLGIMGVLLLFCLVFAAMQTKGFKQFAQKTLIENAQKQGLKLSIGSVEGHPPFQWIINDLYLEINPENKLSAKKAHLRLAFFPMFQNEVAISYLSLHEAKLLFSVQGASLPPLSLPFNISLRSLRADKIEIEKFETKKKALFSFRGKGNLKKKISSFLAELKLSSDDYPNSFIALYLKMKDSYLESLVQIHAKSTAAFYPLITLPFEYDGFLEGTLSGPWGTWKSLVNSNQSPPSLPLTGRIKARVNKLEIPHLKIANRRWDFNSLFQLSSKREINFKQIDLRSNLFTLESTAKLNQNNHIEELRAHFSFPQLRLFSLYLPIVLEGSLSGQLDISENRAIFEMQGNQFSIGAQDYSRLNALVKAQKENGEWKGSAELLADNKRIPIIGHSDFTLNAQQILNVKDFLITAPETKIAADLWIDFLKKEIEGSFFGQILSLRPYRAWVSRHSGLDGNIGAALSFQGKNAIGSLALKNLYYFQTFSDTIKMDFSLLFDPFQASLSLEGEKLHRPPFYFSQYGFQTEWDEKKGPYYLFAKGEWKDPFSITAKGSWTPSSLNINHFYGTLLKKDFSLEKPCSLILSNDHLTLSECLLNLGTGHLSTAIDLNKESSHGYLQATHFPLELLFISHPNFSLSGNTTIEAILEGNEEDLTGKANLLLEEVDLYQSGKTSPLHAKGYINAQLKKKIVECTSHISTSDGQFFKGDLFFPIDYSLFPFNLKLDEQRPLSGEISLQGKVEEIFDFINIGSHRVSGEICSQIKISQTLDKPFLIGTLDLYQGHYENYYTGTHLKQINAHLEATGEKINLQAFHANDDQGGKLSGTGELLLDPQTHFPYEALIDLDDINLLKFDKVKSNFIGPLTISGNSQSAIAKGSLTVSKADLAIPDTISSDLPIIPVTYINRPAHLEQFTIQPLSLFPFMLELDLTAPGSVYLRGKGLRSEWQGKAFLSGSNANIKARGNLNLVKGEFVFSGKTFTLNQGEILFTDQGSEQAYISLKGELQLPEVTVTAILNGPLSAPVLTFQSTPYMPTSSILSHILFNKDISDITAFQALQVAQTIVTLSGGAGPDVLEKIRKSIGVDRLNIVSSSQNPDEVALQIGKYLTKGVMVTLSQGFNSSQVIVEVELKYGFLLQAETQEVEEGKFSLKWNRNY